MIWHTDLNTKKNSLRKPEQEQGQQKNKFKDLMRSYWQQYCEKSTIHGVRYIYDPTVRSIESNIHNDEETTYISTYRLIWSALVITCVTLTCIAYVVLAERFSSQKLQTVVENSQYPVFEIPFPAVGICTNNRINWQKFEEAKAQFLPSSADKGVVKVFTSFVERMETLRFGSFESFKDMEDINLETIDSVNVSKLARFLAINCEDIFVNGSCRWRTADFECCSRFILERTEYGECLVFNSELSPESRLLQENLGAHFYPAHNSKAGQSSGLNFKLKFSNKLKKPNSTLEDTVTILIKRPNQFSKTGYSILPSTGTFVVIRPEVTESDEEIRTVPPLKRSCLFENEHDLQYSKANISKEWLLRNCLNACHEEHIRKYCNCTLSLFFLYTDDTVEQCRPSNFRCLAKNDEIFSYDKRKEEDAYFSSAKPGMTCSCLIPCNTVEYFTSLTSSSLPVDEVGNDTNVKLFHVDVHYQSEVVIRYRSSLEFTSIDLIANFGGIFGLCLGASLVSAVELLYYLTFGFGLYLYDNDYFAVLKENLKTLRQKWAKNFKNSFKDASELGNTTKRKLSFLPKYPHRKQNHW